MAKLQIDYDTFLISLERRMSKSKNSQEMLAIFFVEFDDFSYLEEIIGLVDETLLLHKIQFKIDTIVKNDSLYTYKGKHQCIIAHSISSLKDAEIFAKYFIHTFSEPCNMNSHMFYIFMSIGISIYPIGSMEPKELLLSAKTIMKRIQKEGKNLFSLQQAIHSPIISQYYVSISKELPEALEKDEIFFLYQPQYSYKEKRFTGAEILCRWEHPTLGIIPPSIFIPLAEQSGMIAPLTVRAIVTAAKMFSFLKENQIHDFSLSINISPTFLMSGEFNDTISFLLSQYDLNKEQLHFEITEEIIMQHNEYLKQTLLKLKNQNIGIELDDFGTGYTSLQHLAYLPIDTLKIDRSFIEGIESNKRKKSLFKAIIDISHALDINVIAEGVETFEEENYLREFNSLIIQGYLYSRPLSQHQLIPFLQKSMLPV